MGRSLAAHLIVLATLKPGGIVHGAALKIGQHHGAQLAIVEVPQQFILAKGAKLRGIWPQSVPQECAVRHDGYPLLGPALRPELFQQGMMLRPTTRT